ncbi:MAG: NADH-quinone oxidoreductase subunit H [Myxococcota bacterium]|nr:NADH-quinone oxidoreductase subunit H [Myxococcota bacterium]
MKWLGVPATVFLAVALLVLAGSRSCVERDSAQLVQVLELTPSEAEVGDRITLFGAGFPSGKPAHVTFRGSLQRPGEAAVTDAEIVLPGQVVGAQRVDVAFDEVAQALFCGGADRAMHTTFHGDVEVAFPAPAPGTSPLAGVLQGTTLDVRPSRTAADVAVTEKEGGRVLAWMGVRAVAGASGLFVEGVEPAGPAALAGIVPGDVLSTFDGVRVASLGDVVPRPGEREAILGIRHGRAASESLRSVSIRGFRRAPPTELLGACVIVIAALAVVAFFGAPTPPRLAAAIHRVARRVHARRAAASARTSGSERQSKRPRATIVWRVPDAVEAVACAALMALPLGQYLVASRLDVGVLFVSAATALTVSALVTGRSLGSNGPAVPWWTGLRDAAHVAWQHAPAAVAVANAIVTTGSLRVQEVEGAQGGWPWDWLAFRNPAMLVAFLALLRCARTRPDAREPTGLAAWCERSRPSTPSPRGLLLESACRVHRLIVAGLASSLFLGGWLLPGLSSSQQGSRGALAIAGAAWFLVKTSSLTMAISWSEWALPGGALAERSRRAAVWLAASGASMAASFAWTRWSPDHSTQYVVSGSLVGIVLLAAMAVAHRIHHDLASPQQGRLSAFL